MATLRFSVTDFSASLSELFSSTSEFVRSLGRLTVLRQVTFTGAAMPSPLTKRSRLTVPFTL